MGNYLGYPSGTEVNTQLIVKVWVSPKRLLEPDQWEAVQQHYLEHSRTQYQRLEPMPAPPVSPLFEPVPVPVTQSVISMVGIDPPDRALLIGASQPPAFLVVRPGEPPKPIPVHTEPVMFERLGQNCRLTLIGHLGHDARVGQIADFDLRDGSRRVLLDKHSRIASHRTADVDGDGRDELLVCGFGDYPTGRVGIWWNNAGKLEEEILLEEAGTCWGDIADLDGDGDRDLVLVIGSNRCRIQGFINQGNRQLVPTNIVQRPVGWGYNRCLLADWDGDGKLDLVETAGNNLESRGRPLKNWHGVRVLRNEGSWKFREVLFERLPGAIDVATGDFDGNGRVDLAVTSFYPDWRQPFPTTFLLLLQQSDGSIQRFGLDDLHWHRWMRIGAGDADGDGDTDLMLGAADVPGGLPTEIIPRYKELVRGKPSVLLMRNRTIP
jgi:hypothetical protein